MKLLSLTAFCFTSFLVMSQNKINQYEYWFDADFANKITTSITPVQHYTLNTSVSTTALNTGLHTVHVRFRDDSTRFSSVASSFFMKAGASVNPTALMSNYEYWFDSNYAAKVVGSLSSSQVVNFSQNASTSLLNPGLHTLHIRFQDNIQQWSSVTSQFFYKQGGSVAVATPEMVQYQYWFDSNFSGAITSSLPGNAVENVITGINAIALNNGLHTFHVRFKDALGQWSSVVSQFFMKQESNAFATVEMAEYEYWFDTDYANKVNVTMAGNQVETVLAGLSASTLNNGLHTFQIRFKDASLKWSSVISQFFIKNAPSNSINNLITAYRYWFDLNDADMVTVALPTPIQQFTLTTPISMTQIPKGTHTVHFQFQDTLNMWSSVTNDTLYKNSLPIADFTADTTILCDNGTVNFDNLSIDGDQFLWDFGDGFTSTDSLATHIYSTPGDYSVTLTAIDPIVPIDSALTITQMIHVYGTPDPTIYLSGNDSLCAGSTVTLSTDPTATYLWSDGSTQSTLDVIAAGNYSVTVYNINNPSCFAISGNQSIVLMPLPNASYTFSNVDHTVTFVNTSAEGDTYLWNYGNGTTSTTTSPVYDYGVNGVYDSYLVSYNFCGTDTAFATIDLSYIGLTDLPITHELKLYPNPTNSNVWIANADSKGNQLNYVITDSQGKIVIQSTLDVVEGVASSIDFSGLMNGTYYLKLENKLGWMSIEKIIVNRQ